MAARVVGVRYFARAGGVGPLTALADVGSAPAALEPTYPLRWPDHS